MFQLLTTAKVSIFVFVLMTEYFNIGESGDYGGTVDSGEFGDSGESGETGDSGETCESDESGETTLTEISLPPMCCGSGATYCKARYLSLISQMAGIAYHRGIREFTSVIIFNYCLFAQ